MKSLMQLLRCVLADASAQCCASTLRDFETISDRVEHEGLSFLAITLPTFGSDFERSLDQGYVATNMFLGFKKHASLPCLFKGLMSQVFDSGTGLLLDKPSTDCIFFIRQVTMMWKKINLDCVEKRIRGAFDGYIQCESDLRDRIHDIPRADLDRFSEVARLLWGSTLQDLELSVRNLALTPRHGPGATAERISGNRKYRLKRWHTRLEPFFPLDLFGIPNWDHVDQLEDLEISEPETEIPVRVITVPKTLKTPRIIAIEPVCMQYTQQSILRELVPLLESSSLLRGALGFTDQKPNQLLAKYGSEEGSLATIDLSEASDRVSNHLVIRMLESLPALSAAIQACRSLQADVPGHGVIPLTKFASMGSALCFPIEAMVFLTIVSSVWHKRQGARVSLSSIRSSIESVRIYGDDIIVPVEMAPDVACELSRFNLKVNERKSFWTGRFRESCGKDWYEGHDVTVVYVRSLLPTSHRDATAVVSTVSLINQFYRAGLWRSSSYLRDYLERQTNVPLPVVSERSSALGLHSFWQQSECHRFCERLFRPMVKAYKVFAKPPPDPLDGPAALMKCFLHQGDEPMSKDHLERHGRPKHVNIKLGWYLSD